MNSSCVAGISQVIFYSSKKNINAIFSEIVVLLFLHVLPILTLILQQIDHQESDVNELFVECWEEEVFLNM